MALHWGLVIFMFSFDIHRMIGFVNGIYLPHVGLVARLHYALCGFCVSHKTSTNCRLLIGLLGLYFPRQPYTQEFLLVLFCTCVMLNFSASA
ncbi:hypothetical protein P153DRAFT_137564 [Dothidotthia symphoricarpi CBS 119687]|uniref:Uncharacterized protein n=1 Tax=Dothidotthia symphoricarpi CBS 119687 TaxID=1392245 RepID=A0A6A5ZY62_9PLEO|nr:uncharacterized protein P153DRAFT_137564 [Dothidotthia symphoricarpi CBS 119687]KAF2124226.1 hypothetical protein P153DRAFT_137564 [Dothidotthia symphoricarpi CBS 119687]